MPSASRAARMLMASPVVEFKSQRTISTSSSSKSGEPFSAHELWVECGSRIPFGIAEVFLEDLIRRYCARSLPIFDPFACSVTSSGAFDFRDDRLFSGCCGPVRVRCLLEVVFRVERVRAARHTEGLRSTSSGLCLQRKHFQLFSAASISRSRAESRSSCSTRVTRAVEASTSRRSSSDVEGSSWVSARATVSRDSTPAGVRSPPEGVASPRRLVVRSTAPIFRATR